MDAPFESYMLLKRTYSGYGVSAQQGVGSSHSSSDRDALVEAHLPQVKFIAERLASKLPPSVDRDDLIGAGLLGLLDAVDKFDPARGVQFKTYAEMRVRGAMLDSLRSLDWAPRSMRQRAREVEAAYRNVEQRVGRPAEEEEVAEALGVSTREFHALLNELQGLTLLDLDGGEEEDRYHGSQIPDDPSRCPLAQYERSELRALLIQAIDRLPHRERQVIAFYYLEELTMKEVGIVMGITESRVSQLHTQAILWLRSSLNSR